MINTIICKTIVEFEFWIENVASQSKRILSKVEHMIEN